ncbi:hypothetical protein BT93_G1308 [Corymbia citriodora subsp. variegata]|nr:hypothetical protein BT93_G1308 [Corymbia citriodora subsp. variegata]
MMDRASPAMETPKSEAPTPCEARRQGGLPLPRAEPTPFIGKHRLAASITHLQNQITIIQEELEELETIGEASLVCRDLIIVQAHFKHRIRSGSTTSSDEGSCRCWLGAMVPRRPQFKTQQAVDLKALMTFV